MTKYWVINIGLWNHGTINCIGWWDHDQYWVVESWPNIGLWDHKPILCSGIMTNIGNCLGIKAVLDLSVQMIAYKS
jgi:hypothetical protein